MENALKVMRNNHHFKEMDAALQSFRDEQKRQKQQRRALDSTEDAFGY
jgi:hypothetical protein